MNALANERFEQALAESLPTTRALAAKVAAVHGGSDARLIELKERFDELTEDLQDETQALSRHAAVESFLTAARELTSNYEPPEWGCGTLVRYFEALSALDQNHKSATA